MDPTARQISLPTTLAMSPPAAVARQREEKSFEALFDAALQKQPGPSPITRQTGPELVYLLTGGTPIAPYRPQGAPVQLPPAIAWQQPAVAKPGGMPPLQRMEDFKRKIDRMTVPQSTLDVRVDNASRPVVAKAPATGRTTSRTLVSGVSALLKSFDEGAAAWPDVEQAAKKGQSYLTRLAQRTQGPVSDALAGMRDALGALQEAASKMETPALVEAGQSFALASDALQAARTT